MSDDTLSFHGWRLTSKFRRVWAAFSDTLYYTTVCMEHGVSCMAIWHEHGGMDAMFRFFCTAQNGTGKAMGFDLGWDERKDNVYGKSKLELELELETQVVYTY
jgi:hypothetical protein